MTTGDDSLYTVLVVDDEAPARILLQEYLRKIPQAELAGCCADVAEAMDTMQHRRIDILLSDIQMPGISGIAFIRGLPYRPAVIFTTAYSEYAVEGFDLGVVDYLLKPIGFPRFLQAMQKAMEHLRMTRRDVSRTAGATAYAETPDFITVRADHRLYKLNFRDILYIEGQHEYVTFHTLQRKVTAYYSLKTLEEQLPAAQFVRIHKSYMVSLAHIDMADSRTITVHGRKLPVGSSYKDTLLSRLRLK